MEDPAEPEPRPRLVRRSGEIVIIEQSKFGYVLLLVEAAMVAAYASRADFEPDEKNFWSPGGHWFGWSIIGLVIGVLGAFAVRWSWFPAACGTIFHLWAITFFVLHSDGVLAGLSALPLACCFLLFIFPHRLVKKKIATFNGDAAEERWRSIEASTCGGASSCASTCIDSSIIDDDANDDDEYDYGRGGLI